MATKEDVKTALAQPDVVVDVEDSKKDVKRNLHPYYWKLPTEVKQLLTDGGVYRIDWKIIAEASASGKSFSELRATEKRYRRPNLPNSIGRCGSCSYYESAYASEQESRIVPVAFGFAISPIWHSCLDCLLEVVTYFVRLKEHLAAGIVNPQSSVSVQRTAGAIETDWMLDQMTPVMIDSLDRLYVRVVKYDEKQAKTIHKIVPLKEFVSLNPNRLKQNFYSSLSLENTVALPDSSYSSYFSIMK